MSQYSLLILKRNFSILSQQKIAYNLMDHTDGPDSWSWRNSRSSKMCRPLPTWWAIRCVCCPRGAPCTSTAPWWTCTAGTGMRTNLDGVNREGQLTTFLSNVAHFEEGFMSINLSWGYKLCKAVLILCGYLRIVNPIPWQFSAIYLELEPEMESKRNLKRQERNHFPINNSSF